MPAAALRLALQIRVSGPRRGALDDPIGFSGVFANGDMIGALGHPGSLYTQCAMSSSPPLGSSQPPPLPAFGSLDDVTIQLQTSFDPSPAPEPFVLRIIKGPDKGQSFVLDGSQPSRVHLGQSKGCDIRLSDPTVSRRHVTLDVEGGRVRVSDLGSKNGTRIDGVKIVEALVQGGETIRVGSTLFRLERDTSAVRVPLPSASGWGRMVGASTEMRRLYPLCDRLAASTVSVIIEGEMGSGKELLAECLHEQGVRSSGPFVVFDCTVIPPAALDAALLGTWQDPSNLPGAIEKAGGGTLFINEISELPLGLQTKLLRILEHRGGHQSGAAAGAPLDLRLIVSTRRDLDREVSAGRFREELLHRLGVARIELPPLRRRRGDVMLLAHYFCRDLGGSEHALQNALRLGWDENAWPGNVRELRTTVARHLALGELAALTVEAPTTDSENAVSVDDIIEEALTLPLGEARQRVVVEFERRYVRRVLERHAGNVTHAAESAGVARRYFQILKARVEKRRKDP